MTDGKWKESIVLEKQVINGHDWTCWESAGLRSGQRFEGSRKKAASILPKHKSKVNA